LDGNRFQNFNKKNLNSCNFLMSNAYGTRTPKSMYQENYLNSSQGFRKQSRQSFDGRLLFEEDNTPMQKNRQDNFLEEVRLNEDMQNQVVHEEPLEEEAENNQGITINN